MANYVDVMPKDLERVEMLKESMINEGVFKNLREYCKGTKWVIVIEYLIVNEKPYGTIVKQDPARAKK